MSRQIGECLWQNASVFWLLPLPDLPIIGVSLCQNGTHTRLFCPDFQGRFLVAIEGEQYQFVESAGRKKREEKMRNWEEWKGEENNRKRNDRRGVRTIEPEMCDIHVQLSFSAPRGSAPSVTKPGWSAERAHWYSRWRGNIHGNRLMKEDGNWRRSFQQFPQLPKLGVEVNLAPTAIK